MDNTLLLDKNVLVAGDNSINEVAKDVLMIMGSNSSNIDIVRDEFEAVKNFKHKKYDLVLIDVEMPGMNGYEVAQYLRKELKENTPIIAIGAFIVKGEEEKCYAAGMNGRVHKPVSFESLKTGIESVLCLPPLSDNKPHILKNKDVAVDISILYEVAADDAAYIQLMVNTFLENMPQTLNKIERSYKEEDYESLYSAAHYAKSSLSVIKINEMFEWVQKIEAVAKHKANIEVLPDLIEKVKTRFSAAKHLLSAKFLPSYNAPL